MKQGGLSSHALSVCAKINDDIYLCQRIIELNDGHAPLTYKRFLSLINRMDAVELPAEAVTLKVIEKCVTPISEDHDDKFGVPSLEELGMFVRHL